MALIQGQNCFRELLSYKHTKCQVSLQVEHQASAASVSGGPHRLVLAAYLDAPNRTQTHSQNLTLTLTLTLNPPLINTELLNYLWLW